MIYDELQQDSVLDIKNDTIIINMKYGEDLIESAKCVAHEHRHYYQLALIQQEPDNPLSIRLIDEFKNSQKITDYNDLEQLYGSKNQ